MALPFGWALPTLARRLPTFFHGSTSVRTEACSSDPPIVFPSATPHVFLRFCLQGKASLQRSNNLLVGTWFRKHLHRTTVPLIVPTIEDEKCLAMTYHPGITSHE
jgi:hypothetical protein